MRTSYTNYAFIPSRGEWVRIRWYFLPADSPIVPGPYLYSSKVWDLTTDFFPGYGEDGSFHLGWVNGSPPPWKTPPNPGYSLSLSSVIDREDDHSFFPATRAGVSSTYERERDTVPAPGHSSSVSAVIDREMDIAASPSLKVYVSSAYDREEDISPSPTLKMSVSGSTESLREIAPSFTAKMRIPGSP